MNYPVTIGISVPVILVGGWLLWRKLRENQRTRYEFITIIAHKFRTPLTEIKWTLESGISLEKDPLQKKNLEDMQKANEKLIVLMGTLIDLTNKNGEASVPSVFERVELCDFVREVSDMLKGAFQEKNLTFTLECPEPELAATIEKVGMRFAVRVLLENAITYTPPGRLVKAIIFRRGSKAYISVIDNGIGVRPGDLRKVFSQFYRARNAKRVDTEGVGVSLFMAKSTVRRNKGKMYAFSEGVDRGSTFTIVLPLAK